MKIVPERVDAAASYVGICLQIPLRLKTFAGVSSFESAKKIIVCYWAKAALRNVGVFAQIVVVVEKAVWIC